MARGDLKSSIQQKTKLISDRGGMISLMGMVNLVIPEGALPTPTQISIALCHQADNTLALHFEPHGTLFIVPARLTIAQACWEGPVVNPVIDIYYRSNQLQPWQFAQFVAWYKTPEAFNVQIPHFSSYYFIRRQSYSVSRFDDDREQAEIRSDGPTAAKNRTVAGANSEKSADDHVVDGNQSAPENAPLKDHPPDL